MLDLAELHRLQPIDKLRIIETLWTDLASDEDSLKIPLWHESELMQTAEAYRAGQVDALDWSAAKDELR